MGMLQTVKTADDFRHFNVPQTTIPWLRPRLQKIGTTWKHPRGGRPTGTTPSRGGHIRLKHLWHQWRTSTRTVAETPGRHNARISTQTMRNHPGDLHCVPDDHIWAPFWIGIGVVQGSTGWRYNAFSVSIRLTQDFSRSNAVHTLPWPAYSLPCTAIEHRRGTSLIAR